MSDMIERVAVAIFCSQTWGEGWPAEMPESAKDHYRKQARAAVASMRDPTMLMVKNGFRADSEYANDDDTADQWRRMIDAALAPADNVTEESWTECAETTGPPIRGKKAEQVFVPADNIIPGSSASFCRKEGGKTYYWMGVIPEIKDGYAIFTLTDDKRVTPADG